MTTVGEEFVEGVLASPYDGSMTADRAISGFVSRWIDHLIDSVEMQRRPAGPLGLRRHDRPPGTRSRC